MSPPTAADLPWLQPSLSTVRASLLGQRPPHSMLIAGPAGIGLTLLAEWLVALRQCEDRTAAPCGVCRSCRWLAAGQHPDHHRLVPIEDSREIRIDQVREVMVELGKTSHRAAYKTALVDPAEQLNRQAANAFLKTLEEPSASTLLVLVSTQPSRIPATLRSRCFRLDVAAPSVSESLDWLVRRSGGSRNDWSELLGVAGNRPLDYCDVNIDSVLPQIRALVRDIRSLVGGEVDSSQLVKSWNDDRYIDRLRWLENLITKKLLDSVGSPTAHLRAGAWMPKLRPMFELLDRIREDRALAETTVNRGYGLQVLLLAVQAAFRASQPAGVTP